MSLAMDMRREAVPPVSADVRPVPRISIHAFCETPDFASVMQEAAADRRMARARIQIETGGIAAAGSFYHSAATPNLIIVESKLPRLALEAALDQLSEVCDAGTKVIIVGHLNDVALYRALMHRGISEYLVMPVDLMGLMQTVSALYADSSTGPLGRSIAFIGGKGGVGSSMVAHNVAWAIGSDLANEVVIADLDLAFGTAGLDFNQDPAQGIADAVNSPERLDDVLLDRLLSRCSERLSVLAAPATLDRTYDFGETAFDQVIEVAQAGVPSLVLDLPHVWSSWVRRTLLAADEVVLTVEPDLANLRNAKNIVDLLRQERRNDAPPRLVINKNGLAKRPEIKVADFAGALDLTPAAVIPFDAHLFGTAANNGQMIAEADARSPVAECFRQIASLVMARGEVRQPKRSVLAPLVAKLRGAKG